MLSLLVVVMGRRRVAPGAGGLPGIDPVMIRGSTRCAGPCFTASGI